MKLVELKCPNCGSNLKVDENSTLVLCQFCGTQFKVDNVVKHIQYDNAEQTGYEFEKGRMKAKEDAIRQQQALEEQQRKEEQEAVVKKIHNSYSRYSIIICAAMYSMTIFFLWFFFVNSAISIKNMWMVMLVLFPFDIPLTIAELSYSIRCQNADDVDFSKKKRAKISMYMTLALLGISVLIAVISMITYK